METRAVWFYLLIGIVFLVAPFYTEPTIGGTGFHLPFNISIWLVAPWFMAAGVLLSMYSRVLRLPREWWLFIPFLLILILSGLLNNDEPIVWLFRIGAVFGGALFLFALFQFNLSSKNVELALYCLLLAMFFHGLVAAVQTQEISYLLPWFLQSPNGVPYGVFQQINIQSSYMATSLVIVTYLMSRPRFLVSRWPLKFALLVIIATSSYVIFSSGSRVGLLGVLLSLPIIAFVRRRQLARHKGFILICLLVINSNAWNEQDGVSRSLVKIADLTQNVQSARLAMYTIGTELVFQKPLLGHGIGSFNRVWAQQSGDFHNRYPNAVLPNSIVTIHPHNEFLYWLIEGGSIIVLGMILIIAAVGMALYQCGLSRGGAYLAMLIPITLHTQVELPFYGSSIHWFTWLFLLFLPLRHQVITYGIRLSRSAVALIYITSLSLSLLVSSLMLHTLRAQADIFRFLHGDRKPPHLQIAINNLYFKPLAIEAAMRSTLYGGIQNDDEIFVREFVTWASKLKPVISMTIYEDIAVAYNYLDYTSVDCKLVQVGSELYSYNEKIHTAYQVCKVKNKTNRVSP